jgi:hypothetical protein
MGRLIDYFFLQLYLFFYFRTTSSDLPNMTTLLIVAGVISRAKPLKAVGKAFRRE